MASETTRQLILLRHAKSDWPDVPDRERPLAKRGRRDAPRIGAWLHEHGYQPDVVVCSDARRARQTWDLAAPELGGSPAVRFEPRAYAASALTLLYLARELPGRHRSALFVGHNPGLSELASQLTAHEDPALSLPTAAVAILEFPGDWSSLTPDNARLISLTTPASL